MKSSLLLRLVGLLALVVAVGLLTGCQRGAPQPAKATPTMEKTFPSPVPETPASNGGLGAGPDARAGGEVFARTCNACHPGGQQGLGPSLVGVVGRISEQGVIRQVRSGGGIMPAFSQEQVTDKQMEDLVAYLKSLGGAAGEPTATPAPTLVATHSPTPLPLVTPQVAAGGDIKTGAQVFGTSCNACHPDGRKGLGPELVGVTQRLTKEQIVRQIRNGGSIMPAFPPDRITDQQLADLLTYLASLK